MPRFGVLLRRQVERLGYLVHRLRATRFDGMQAALQLLHNRGYRPGVIIDCGANVGEWMQVAAPVFPGATWHAIEPQRECVAALERFRAADRIVTVHATALTAPGVHTVRMYGGEDGAGPGNFVSLPDEVYEDGAIFPATTLDDLLADRIQPGDRTLLKLDVEGHEIPVLSGAARLLTSVEVVLSETSVFDISGKRPVFADLVAFMREHAFEFYDVAVLSDRRRDHRLRQMDVIFVRRDSPLLADRDWT